MYAVTARVVRDLPNGYSSGRDLPTFYLDENVQGILTATHAEKIVRHMIRAILPTGDTPEIYVTAVRL